MLVNRKSNDTKTHVKFVNYTGKYPNLCSGILTLEIDGIEYTFGSIWKVDTDFKKFWCSGGSVTANEDWDFNVTRDEWEIDVDDIPEQFRKYATEIDEVFNENVDWGCCGGCV